MWALKLLQGLEVTAWHFDNEDGDNILQPWTDDFDGLMFGCTERIQEEEKYKGIWEIICGNSLSHIQGPFCQRAQEQPPIIHFRPDETRSSKV